MTSIANLPPPRDDNPLSIARHALQKHIPVEEIPASEDLLGASELQARLDASSPEPFTLLVVGDIMMGGRAHKLITENGPQYPFAAVLPLLRRSSLILGNLEGPFARAKKLPRTHSYRTHPRRAIALADAGFGVVNLANNHLLDCGRAGVMETLETLKAVGIDPLGAGRDEGSAHAPVIRQVGSWRVGMLGYYWNRRCAATPSQPGSAMDRPDRLAADIRALRPKVDRLVAIHHWGVPYAREPSTEDRAKARLAIDCGADLVIGHHSHVVGPLEVYRGRPIFFSVGNFMLGSGNSRAEGMALGIRIEQTRTVVTLVPLYVKNRDPRVAYQPKAIVGNGAHRQLRLLAQISGPSGKELHRAGDWCEIVLPYVAHTTEEA